MGEFPAMLPAPRVRLKIDLPHENQHVHYVSRSLLGCAGQDGSIRPDFETGYCKPVRATFVQFRLTNTVLTQDYPPKRLMDHVTEH